MPPQTQTPDATITPILQAHEDSITSTIPPILKPLAPTSPSKMFQNYVTTGDTAFKDAAGTALNKLTSFADSAKKAASFLGGQSTYDRQQFFQNAGVPSAVPETYKSMFNTVPQSYVVPSNNKLFSDTNVATPAILADIVGNQENQQWLANPSVNHNHDGSMDIGFAQLNSNQIKKVIQPYFTDVLKKPFNVFDPQDNLLGAAVILNANATLFKNKTGRLPTESEMKDVYNHPVEAANEVVQAQKEAEAKAKLADK